jgi:Asp-tRNA(Asn)/Glu-tRNA(Gln) amidotransferase C subunit
MSPTDAIIVLQKNNKPIASLNVSHTIAKTLANQLAGVIENFERQTKIEISTLDQVVEAIQDANKNRDSG